MKTALGVIDVQNSLLDEGPWQPELLLERVQGLIQKARTAGVPIVFVTDRRVEPDGAIHPSLSVAPGDLQVQKSESNSFEDTPLDGLLRARGVERLIVAGLQTDYCINATCRGAPLWVTRWFSPATPIRRIMSRTSLRRRSSRSTMLL